jgi:putative transposase
MIQVQLKLRMTKAQERECDRWLVHLGSIWNWAIRKIELNAADRIYFSRNHFTNLLAEHSHKLGIPSHVIQGTLRTAHLAWANCFKKLSGRPRLKGMRNKMATIPFPDPIRSIKGNRVSLVGIGSLRFHRMTIPDGNVKCGRIVKRSSGWYLCLFIDAEPRPIARLADGRIGIDPGFSSLLTTSEGEVISHPREFEALERRLGQAQRGNRRKLVARLHERIANRRKDRNHKLSRQLIETNSFVAFSVDRHKAVARRFGKSVASSGHYQLRRFLAYKSPISGTQYVEVDSRNSTKTCSNCGAMTGPTGLAGLKVRQWRCTECGIHHDRDVNAARNTLLAAVGMTVESRKASGILLTQEIQALAQQDLPAPPSPVEAK